MLQFDQFVERHGEVVAQAILENLERFEGVQSNRSIPLEQRWKQLITLAPQQRLAA